MKRIIIAIVGWLYESLTSRRNRYSKLMLLICLVVPLHFASAQDRDSLWLYDRWTCFQHVDALDVGANNYTTWFLAGEYMGYVESVLDLLAEAERILVPYDESLNQMGRKVSFLLEMYYRDRNPYTDNEHPYVIIMVMLQTLYPIPKEGM